MIQQQSQALFPIWLRFLRGVVDSEDIPLNISRETMQDSALLAKIRDVLTNETPVLFRKEIYATACLAGAILYLLLYPLGVDRNINLVISIFLIFVIRILAVKYKLALPNFKR